MKQKIFFLLLLLLPIQVFGAQLTFKTVPNQNSGSNAATLEVWLNPQGKNINSVEGVIALKSAHRLENKYSVAIETGDSVFTLWPIQPEYSAKENVIRFSGGMTRGFTIPSRLFRISLSAPVSDQATLSWLGGSAYLNDGQGTKEAIAARSVVIALESVSDAPATQSPFAADKTPPHFDTMEIGHDPDTFDGQWFVSFRATDNSSGIDHYEITEGQTSTSTTNGLYIFQDQTRQTRATIVAYDRAGNKQTARAPLPTDWLKTLALIILIIMAVLLASWFGYKKFWPMTLFCFLFFGFAGYATAASFSFTGNYSGLHVGDVTTVNVVINTDNQTINSASGEIDFPTDTVEVLSVSKASSIFPLWVEEPSFSNTTGTINFEGGVPNPGWSGLFGKVLSITFRAKKEGAASFTFGDAAISANDGLGTNVLQSTPPPLNIGLISPAATLTPTAGNKINTETPNSTSTNKNATFASSTIPSLIPPLTIIDRLSQWTLGLLLLSILSLLATLIVWLEHKFLDKRTESFSAPMHDLKNLQKMMAKQIAILEQASYSRDLTKEERVILNHLKSWINTR